MGTTQGDRQPATHATPMTAARPRLLVVEPEALLRWAMVTYLGRWFEVFQSATATAACGVLESESVDAVVVSGELGRSAAESVERCARERNPSARVVRTITDPNELERCPPSSVCLEKPFRLSDLADLLDAHRT